MGYMAHDAVIAVIHGYDEESIARIAEFKQRLVEIGETEFALLGLHPFDFFFGPVNGVNGEQVYAFLPDGSKEGWDFSNRMQELREEFIQLGMGTTYEDGSHSGDVVAVRFGGDYGYEQGSQIVFTTDKVHA